MSKNASVDKPDTGLSLEQIKRIAVTAMFSDDELFENLVLKGGNALNLIHRLGTRYSMDLDFSMRHDWPGGVAEFRIRVERTLIRTFQQYGYVVFDVRMEEKPNPISSELADFWGGYAVEFKLIPFDLHEQYKSDINLLRRHAVSIGQGKKFLIDVSRFEYTEGKQQVDLDGYRIYVYSPDMIVCEKLRAICQQMPEYGPIVRRERQGTARARDFVDIHVLLTQLAIDITSKDNTETLMGMFDVKNVPLGLLGRICEYREFHRTDFPAVQATVAPGEKLEDFDFYYDFVLGLVGRLEPLWNK